ncbi:MAG: ATP-binding cassette domain-containing protein [Anaerolineae bacterium]|nr:ATP-binding cassette domain-containing protein [Anaerolineae bacterium]
MASVIVEVNDLHKKYGDFHAVQGISFAIQEGEVFGLLGPNGAGKSTTISMLTGLFPPTSGSIRVGSYDAVKQTDQVKKIIGVVPQDIALYAPLSARANLRFFGEMFGLSGKELNARVDSVLEIVAMHERANDAVSTFSGGMKRRINLAVGLINNPRMLFLDEPTVGVDPQSRNHIFESVERLNRENGMTLLYTTHYMEEAERLCHRVAIIDGGKIIAIDTPRNLIGMLGGGILQIGMAEAVEELRAAVAALPTVQSAAYMTQKTGESQTARVVMKIETRQANAALLEVINFFNDRGVNMLSLETLEPNLESVFLHLTGKSLRS